jgi:hypothetical protein
MNVQDMRRHAEHCLDEASEVTDELQRARFVRAAKAWRSLAHSKLQADAALMSNDVEERNTSVKQKTFAALPA